ncbi:TSUP family transporter [Niabella beijingensis]|uniref:TSUP family transporter n=1 Tax=Niabella beijingensis TaxID=2872700 RepID=UPI001CBB52EA|nr:TSUP family transporter [Niabella beijingensis]MBZ4191895.1 TSUP family transporter [Niabella beijingensis]
MNEVLVKSSDSISKQEVSFFLKIRGLTTVILGGGNTALLQLQKLLAETPEPAVKMVAARFHESIQALAAIHSSIRLEERPYESEDLLQAGLVVIAETDPEITDRIINDAEENGFLSVDGALEYKKRTGDAILNSHVVREKEKFSSKRIATYALAAFTFMLIGHLVFSYWPFDAIKEQAVVLYNSLGQSFLIMLAAGFVAQLVDGALGMGYGVTSATILLSAGVNPAAISGSIHTAEMFASGASGYSHYKFGNVNKKLFKALLIPGVIGAIGGAVLLVYLGEKYSDWVRPVLAFYTLFLGLKILYNAFRKQIAKKKFKYYRALAGAGGFFDSFGGGGWGPIVTTTLITKGRSPKYVIGSVSLTEFFVTLSSAFTFFILLGVSHWQTILGLIVGGLIAAPLAAKLAGRLPRKTSFILVGLLVIIWSIKILIKLI